MVELDLVTSHGARFYGMRMPRGSGVQSLEHGASESSYCFILGRMDEYTSWVHYIRKVKSAQFLTLTPAKKLV